MNKLLYFIGALLGLSLACTGCSNANMGDLIASAVAKNNTVKIASDRNDASNDPGTTREFKVGKDVTKFSCYISADVEFLEGEPRLVATGRESDLQSLRIDEGNGYLSLHQTDGRHQTKGLKIKIYSRGLNTMNQYGSGNFIADKLKGTSLSLNIYGSGDFDVKNLDATSAQLGLYGSGHILINSAKVTSLKGNLSGSGDIMIEKCKAASIDAICNGAGNIGIYGIDATTVKGYLNGAGNIDLAGKCTSAALRVNGVGNINATDLKSTRTTKSVSGIGHIAD